MPNLCARTWQSPAGPSQCGHICIVPSWLVCGFFMCLHPLPCHIHVMQQQLLWNQIWLQVLWEDMPHSRFLGQKLSKSAVLLCPPPALFSSELSVQSAGSGVIDAFTMEEHWAIEIKIGLSWCWNVISGPRIQNVSFSDSSRSKALKTFADLPGSSSDGNNMWFLFLLLCSVHIFRSNTCPCS